MPATQKKNNRKMKGGNETIPERVEKFKNYTGENRSPLELFKFKTLAEAEKLQNISVYNSYLKGQKDEFKDLLKDTNPDFILIVNAAMPYPEWYEADKDRPSAGMSYVHLLAVPKKPLYNTVMLKKSDAPMLENMRSTALEVLNKTSIRNEINTYIFDTVNFRGGVKKNITEAEMTKYRSDANNFLTAAPFTEDNIEFAFHVHPDHSVPQLHLHCILKYVVNKDGATIDMRTGNEANKSGYWAHAHKNRPLNEVLEYVNSLQSGGKRNKKNAEKKKKGGDPKSLQEWLDKVNNSSDSKELSKVMNDYAFMEEHLGLNSVNFNITPEENEKFDDAVRNSPHFNGLHPFDKAMMEKRGGKKKKTLKKN